jgi:MFS family permease
MKNFYLLLASRFSGSMYFALPVQTIFFFQKGLSFAQVMWLESVLLAGIIIFEVPTGILGDRIGRKYSLIIGSIIQLISWIPWFLSIGFGLFAVSYFLGGMSIAFQSGSDQAFIFDDLKLRLKESQMQKFYGRFNAAATAGAALSGLAGGFIASKHDMHSFYIIFILCASMQTISLLFLFFLKESVVIRAQNESHDPENKISMLKSGIKLLRGNVKLRKIFLLSMFSSPFGIMLMYIFQPYFKKAGVPNEWYGPAVFITSVLCFIFQLNAYKLEEKAGLLKALFIVTVLPGIGWGLMAVFFNPAAAASLFILTNAMISLRDPVFSDHYNQQIPANIRATVLSLLSLIACIYGLIMRPLLGYLADINLELSFAITAGIIVTGAIFFRINRKFVRKE